MHDHCALKTIRGRSGDKNRWDSPLRTVTCLTSVPERWSRMSKATVVNNMKTAIQFQANRIINEREQERHLESQISPWSDTGTKESITVGDGVRSIENRMKHSTMNERPTVTTNHHNIRHSGSYFSTTQGRLVSANGKVRSFNQWSAPPSDVRCRRSLQFLSAVAVSKIVAMSSLSLYYLLPRI